MCGLSSFVTSLFVFIVDAFLPCIYSHSQSIVVEHEIL